MWLIHGLACQILTKDGTLTSFPFLLTENHFTKTLLPFKFSLPLPHMVSPVYPGVKVELQVVELL